MIDSTPETLRGFPGIFASICRIVVCVIPPLLRLGLIDRTECVAVGTVIGIVVTLRSMHFKPD